MEMQQSQESMRDEEVIIEGRTVTTEEHRIRQMSHHLTIPVGIVHDLTCPTPSKKTVVTSYAITVRNVPTLVDGRTVRKERKKIQPGHPLQIFSIPHSKTRRDVGGQ